MTEQHYLISPFGVCCVSQALQSNCQGYYQLWDICIFTQQQFEVNKHSEIKFGWINVFSDDKLASMVHETEVVSPSKKIFDTLTRVSWTWTMALVAMSLLFLRTTANVFSHSYRTSCSGISLPQPCGCVSMQRGHY